MQRGCGLSCRAKSGREVQALFVASGQGGNRRGQVVSDNWHARLSIVSDIEVHALILLSQKLLSHNAAGRFRERIS
jgi:hypothetical protein